MLNDMFLSCVQMKYMQVNETTMVSQLYQKLYLNFDFAFLLSDLSFILHKIFRTRD